MSNAKAAGSKAGGGSAPGGGGSIRPSNRGNQKEVSRAKPKSGNPDDYYVKIVKHRGRSWGFFVLMGAICVMMTVVLFLHLYTGGPWFGTVVPLILIGLLTLIYPPTEDWLYKPWQAIAQQVERHFYDN